MAAVDVLYFYSDGAVFVWSMQLKFSDSTSTLAWVLETQTPELCSKKLHFSQTIVLVSPTVDAFSVWNSQQL